MDPSSKINSPSITSLYPARYVPTIPRFLDTDYLVSNVVRRCRPFRCGFNPPDRDLIASSPPSQPSKCPSFLPCARYLTARGAAPPPPPPLSPQYQKIAMLPSRNHEMPLRSLSEHRIVPHINASHWGRHRDTVTTVRLRTTIRRSMMRETDRMPRSWLRRGRSCFVTSILQNGGGGRGSLLSV